jgi:hypothetical protein
VQPAGPGDLAFRDGLRTFEDDAIGAVLNTPV